MIQTTLFGFFRKLNISKQIGTLSIAKLLPNAIAGFLTGALSVIYSISFAALIFSGDLSVYLSRGIGFVLFGALVVGLVTALTSSVPASIGIPQVSPAVLLVLLSSSISASMRTTAATGDVFITLVTAIALTTLITGVFFFALGKFELGRFIRFIPYPVIGGFLAGTGWLLFLGGISIMTGISPRLSEVSFLFQYQNLIKWLPGLLIAFVMLGMTRYRSHYLIVPVITLLSVLLFYLGTWIAGASLSEISSHGWLVGPFSKDPLWKPLSLADLSRVNWEVIIGQLDTVGTIVVISLISLLLIVIGIELTFRQDIDLNHELRSAGISNIITGLGFGIVGYLSLSLSVLGEKIGSRSRMVGIFSALFCGVTLFFGSATITFFPRLVLGGLILFVGLTFLMAWVYDAWFKLSKIEYALVMFVLFVVAFFGFLQGVAFGVVVAVIMFVVKYSQISVIKHTLSGCTLQSNVDRAATHRWILRQNGEQISIIKMQGFIFFGTAMNLLNQVHLRANNSELCSLEFIVLDLQQVSGFDSSAINGFERMCQFAQSRQITIVFVHLSERFLHQIEKAGIVPDKSGGIIVFEDLDHGIEWCEDQILKAEGVDFAAETRTLAEHLEELAPGTLDFSKLEKYLERSVLPKGHYLIRYGDPSDDLFFIESGYVTVLMELEGGETIRIRKMGDGTVVGELGMYLNQARTASVVTEESSVVYRLSRKALETMEEKNPQTAATFHRFMVHFLAERLIDKDKTLKTLLS